MKDNRLGIPAWIAVVVAGCAAYGSTGYAEVLPAPAATRAAVGTTTPARGSSMAAVESRFGAPTRRHAPVGGDSPAHPPITRWDYPGFSVFFERDRVIDSVIPGTPPRLHHVHQLQAAP